MTEHTTNKPPQSEIQFGDSAKLHIEALSKGEIDSNNAAAKLKILFDQIDQVDARQKFITDLKAFILKALSESSIDDEKSLVARTNTLFEILVLKMRGNASQPNLTREFGVDVSERVRQATQ